MLSFKSNVLMHWHNANSVLQSCVTLGKKNAGILVDSIWIKSKGKCRPTEHGRLVRGPMGEFGIDIFKYICPQTEATLIGHSGPSYTVLVLGLLGPTHTYTVIRIKMTTFVFPLYPCLLNDYKPHVIDTILCCPSYFALGRFEE